MKSIGNRQLLFLIFALLLVIFLPSFFADVYDVDDVQLLARLHRIKDFDFITLIRGGSGLYYRPFIAASYNVDAFLFNANPFGMHAENVILHILNVFLLIAILQMVFDKESSSYLACFCGFLWGIHPLTTESVNWISGRSDILASTFILLATLFLLRYRHTNNRLNLVLLLFFFVCGVLTKEVMLTFFVMIVLLLRVRNAQDVTSKRWSLLEGRGLLLWLLPVVVVSILFLRMIAYDTLSGRISSTLHFIFNDIYYSLFVCLRAFGFYCKKIIQPFPMNFGIMEVDPLYELLAIPLVALCFYLLFKRDKIAALFLGGVALLTPAFLIAFGQIAWTPYAERYVYLPAAFMLPGFISYFHYNLRFPSFRFKQIVVFLLLCAVATGTFCRNIVWRTNESIFADTAKKSPYNRQIQSTYAKILIDSGDYEQAMIAINKARAVQILGYYPDPDILEANILEKKGDIDAALNVLRHGVENSHFHSQIIIQALINELQVKVDSIEDGFGDSFLREMRELYLAKFKINGNYREIFRMAKISIQLMERDKAVSLLNQVVRNINNNNTLKREATELLYDLSRPSSLRETLKQLK